MTAKLPVGLALGGAHQMHKTVFPNAFSCYKPRHHRIYGAICVTPEDRVLIVKGRRSGKWSFPKGHLESGESALECATRELLEETGIRMPEAPIGCQKLSVGHYYLFETNELTPCIRDTEEISEAEWAPINRLYDMNCNVDVNNFLSRINGNRR